jgi:predicted esterase
MAEMKIVESNSAHDLRKSVNLLADKDILLIAGWDDHNVSLDYIILPLYRTLQKAGAKNVKITAFQDGHSFRNSRDKLARLIIKWIIDQHSPPSGLQSPKSGSTSGSTERRSSSSWFNIQS